MKNLLIVVAVVFLLAICFSPQVELAMQNTNDEALMTVDALANESPPVQVSNSNTEMNNLANQQDAEWLAKAMINSDKTMMTVMTKASLSSNNMTLLNVVEGVLVTLERAIPMATRSAENKFINVDNATMMMNMNARALSAVS